MTATIISGKTIAATVRTEVAKRVGSLRERGIVPKLAVVLVGDDPASAIYVRSKERAAAEVGVDTVDHRMPADTTEEQLLTLVDELNDESSIHGILVQLPLPKHIDEQKVLDRILAAKDVDGFHADNLGRLAQGRPRFVSATPKGCMRLLAESGVELRGARAVVVGRSPNVGKPMAMLLTNADATVTLCHSRSADLAGEVARADVVVAAVGRAGVVRGEWIKNGATVIDVGINRGDDGKLRGDVDFEAAAERAGAITPVPGGVGPMTIAALLENVAQAASVA